MMTNDDHEGRIFLFNAHMNNVGFFSCSPLKTSFYIGKHAKDFKKNPEYAEM